GTLEPRPAQEKKAVIRRSIPVIAPPAAHPGRIGRRSLQRDLRLAPVPQPSRKRNPEAFLLPVDDIVRQDVFQRALEQVLGLTGAKLVLMRDPAGELHDVVVEERGTD